MRTKDTQGVENFEQTAFPTKQININAFCVQVNVKQDDEQAL